MGRRRCKCIAIGLGIATLLLAHALAAQAPDTVLGTRLLAHPVLYAPFPDTLKLELRRHGQYRIAVWPAATQLSVVPVRQPNHPAFAAKMRNGGEFAPTTFELYPQDNGLHLLTVTAPAGTALVRIWVWEDSAAEVAAHVRSERRWSVGLTAGGGSVSGYSIAESNPTSASRYAEAGALLGSGGPLSLVIGFGNDPRPAVDSISVNWGFVEARLRVVHWEVGGREFNVSGTFRDSFGNSSFVIVDPNTLTIGALASWHLDHRRGFRGLSAGLQAMYGVMSNLGFGYQKIWRAGASLSWLP